MKKIYCKLILAAVLACTASAAEKTVAPVADARLISTSPADQALAGEQPSPARSRWGWVSLVSQTIPKNSVWFLSVGIRLVCRIKISIEVAKRAETGKIRAADDDMVEDFNFKELTGADEVAGNFYVGF